MDVATDDTNNNVCDAQSSSEDALSLSQPAIDHDYVSNTVELTTVEEINHEERVSEIENDDISNMIVEIHSENFEAKKQVLKKDQIKTEKQQSCRWKFSVGKNDITLGEIPGVVVKLGPPDVEGISHGIMFLKSADNRNTMLKSHVQTFLGQLGFDFLDYFSLHPILYKKTFNEIQLCLFPYLKEYEIFVCEVNRWCYELGIKYKNELLDPSVYNEKQQLNDEDCEIALETLNTEVDETTSTNISTQVTGSFDDFISSFRSDLRSERSKRWVFYLHNTSGLTITEQECVSIGIASYKEEGCALGMMNVTGPKYRYSLRENAAVKLLHKSGIKGPAFVLPVANNSAYQCIKFCLKPFITEPQVFVETVTEWCRLFEVNQRRNVLLQEKTKRKSKRRKKDTDRDVNYLDFCESDTFPCYSEIHTRLKQLLGKTSSERMNSPRSRRWIFSFKNTSKFEIIKQEGTCIMVGPTGTDEVAYGIVYVEEPTYPIAISTKVAKQVLAEFKIEVLMIHHVLLNYAYQFILFCLKSLRDLHNLETTASAWCKELGVVDKIKKDVKEHGEINSDDIEISTIDESGQEISQNHEIVEEQQVGACVDEPETLSRYSVVSPTIQLQNTSLVKSVPYKFTCVNVARSANSVRSQCWAFSVLLLKDTQIKEPQGVFIKVGPIKPNNLPNGLVLVQTQKKENIITQEVVSQILIMSNVSGASSLQVVDKNSISKWILYCLEPLVNNKEVYNTTMLEWCHKFGVDYQQCSKLTLTKKRSRKIKVDIKQTLMGGNKRLRTIPL
uniref:uncharacterized protein LOC100181196 n=1 Tax=Ciona intestinalis TaxID=7719 RepID=UPI000180C723|nr:uncharacterized protein LOC100181196 [Ciona intestinalis]|eukprot:XP_026692613.1 uncharacterized protein LOC100181196 [Ciona intestinalis]